MGKAVAIKAEQGNSQPGVIVFMFFLYGRKRAYRMARKKEDRRLLFENGLR
jgi:hypothetical protein